MGTIVNETEHLLIESTQVQTEHGSNTNSLFQRTCSESKKLWHIAGPSIFTRLAMFSITVVTQSFAGHLGDLDLAAISIACTVLISITFGFLVTPTNINMSYYLLHLFYFSTIFHLVKS